MHAHTHPNSPPIIVSLDRSKMLLRGRRFSLYEDVQGMLHEWLRDQSKTFLEGIRKLVARWTKCTEKEGGYLGK
jgi:hypothetical protein